MRRIKRTVPADGLKNADVERLAENNSSEGHKQANVSKFIERKRWRDGRKPPDERGKLDDYETRRWENLTRGCDTPNLTSQLPVLRIYQRDPFRRTIS